MDPTTQSSIGLVLPRKRKLSKDGSMSIESILSQRNLLKKKFHLKLGSERADYQNLQRSPETGKIAK
jgi:hypothetical protein